MKLLPNALLHRDGSPGPTRVFLRAGLTLALTLPTVAASAMTVSATAASSSATVAAETSAPTITQVTLPFIATDFSVVSGEEAWAVGGETDQTVRTARILNGVATEIPLPWFVESYHPQIVSTGRNATWVLPKSNEYQTPGYPRRLWRWDNRHWYPSAVPTTTTDEQGRTLYLQEITGSPREGLRGLFSVSVATVVNELITIWSRPNRIGTWDGQKWNFHSGPVCDYGPDVANSGKRLLSAADGWAVVCNPPETWEYLYSMYGSAMNDVRLNEARRGVLVSASEAWVWGDYNYALRGMCYHIIHGTAISCGENAPRLVGSAAITRWGQIFVSTDTGEVYRFRPAQRTYEKVLTLAQPSMDRPEYARLAVSPYSPVLWVLDNETLYRAE